ncbi:LysR family transcriptional regulator [Leucobacter sp. M11]|uniref:LysR family transcriptional regulator n=1 Tax=Leucobacter sp. M11 TaxID=2993565 RepID=UPI002D7FAEE6|nr:LysR family transcriptional regulator [Leucobacter sp. M11]MEB4616339.1 LysR family transcriptional regulator [Leucobacter sp. M11]
MFPDPVLPDLPLRELECFAVVSDTLHFGRAAETLGVSQGRVSQMIKRLEVRVGAALFVRTSRSVRQSALGEQLAAQVLPALAQLRAGFTAAQAAAGSPERPLRIGFQSAVYASVTGALAALPRGRFQLVELPWADPFGKVNRGEVDLALVLSPSHEPGLRQLLEFSAQPQWVALATTHPLASRDRLTAAELGRVPLVAPQPVAPESWLAANAPRVTSDGTPLSYVATALTLPEALSLVTTQPAGVLVCEASAEYLSRPDVSFVPVDGLPPTTLVALTRDADPEHPLVAEFVTRLREATAA